MGKLSEAAKNEIAEAVRILREDGFHIHKTYAQFQKSQADPGKPGPETERKEGDAPPPKPEPAPKPQRRSLIWGDRLNEQ